MSDLNVEISKTLRDNILIEFGGCPMNLRVTSHQDLLRLDGLITTDVDDEIGVSGQ